MKKQLLLLFMLILFFITPMQAFCFDVTAKVSKNKISKDDSIILRIIVQGGDAEVDTSVIRDFKVESRGSGTNVSIINGDFSRTTNYTFLLFPLKTGNLMIPEITVIDGKKTAHTDQISILVSEKEIDETITNDFFAKASIDDSTLFIGQDTVYTFKLFAAANFIDARLIEPEFKFFSVKKLGKKENYTQNINGKIYSVNEINYLVTPESKGDFKIGPARVTMQIPLGRSNNNFDSFFAPRKTVKTIISGDVEIKVNPLPAYTGRDQYKGLIGDFSIKADINTLEIMTDESATLSITVEGSGNIMDTAINGFKLPENSFNIYNDQPEQKEELTSQGYIKKKIFKKALVPIKPGNFTIPEVSLTYFDTKSEQYKLISTEPISIVVKKSAGDKKSNLENLKNEMDKPAVNKQEVKFTGRDIFPLKHDADVLSNQKNISFFIFVILLICPFVLFCLVKFFTSFRKKAKSNALIMKQKARDSLKKAKDPKIPPDQFLSHIRTALVAAIFSKGDSQGESLTKDEARQILQDSDLKSDDIENILTTLNDIDSIKYGGGSLPKPDKKKLFLRTTKLIKLCAVLFFLFSFIALAPLTTNTAEADQAGTLFLEGVNAYNAEKFEVAGQRFETIALNNVKNGKLYYNTANAFLKAGDIGKAVLWYERAKKLMPLDADLEFNLEYTRDKLKDINETKMLNISDILFFWKGYASSNMIRYAAIILSFVFFFYSSVRSMKNKKILTTSGTLLFAFFFLILSAALFDYYQLNNSSSAVIIPAQVSVRSGLSEASTELFVLHAGTKVRIDKKENNFFKIAFSKDKIGWVRKGDALEI